MNTSFFRAGLRSRLALVTGLLLGWACLGGGPAAPELPPLTEVSGSPRLPGKFVWADLVTDDAAAARAFYGGVFQWSFRQAGGYLIAYNQDRPLAGVFQRARPADKPDAHPRWFGYISVPNVAKAERAATAAGGRVLAPAQKLPRRGEQSILIDPEGAVFGLVKSSAGDPPDFKADPGDWVWIQLVTRDARKAAEFYRSVAGYEVVENVQPNRESDYVLTSKGFARATVRTIPAGQKDVRPAWLPFVRVANLGDTLAKARGLGGRVVIEPRPDLLEGKVAVIADPTGAAVGALEWSDSLLKGGR